jgi:hypothetical protein
MSDQTHYEKQPKVLPLTLPAGTRCLYRGWVFVSEARLGKQTPPQYGGTYRDELGMEYTSYSEQDPHYGGVCMAQNIDWTSVPLPTNPDPAALPIQAGDWVECTEHWSHSSPPQGIGDRFEVAGMINGSLCFAEYPGVSWVERFKRVDGPHASAERSPSPMTRLALCLDCSSPATHVSRCVYCRKRETDSRDKMRIKTNLEAAKGASKLLAGLASERPREGKTRPRYPGPHSYWYAPAGSMTTPPVGGSATERELAKIHPWECDE